MVDGGGTTDNAKRPMALGEGGGKCRQVGDKCKVMRTNALRESRENPECLLLENKPGDKRQIMQPGHGPLSKE